MIELQQVSKTHAGKNRTIHALNSVDFKIAAGEFVVVRGPSGSGKTTFLLTVGGMLRPTSGTVQVDDVDVYRLSVRDRARFRAEKIGFVFQMFHLVTYLSVLENVLLASGVCAHDDAKREALDWLERFGLTERLGHTPAALSAGERQRTALARAMLNRPKVILADEPTGNLDPENASQVLKILEEYHRSGGTVVMVTHGEAADRHASRVVELRDGGFC